MTSLGATGLFLGGGGGLIAGLPLNTMIIHTFFAVLYVYMLIVHSAETFVRQFVERFWKWRQFEFKATVSVSYPKLRENLCAKTSLSYTFIYEMK